MSLKNLRKFIKKSNLGSTAGFLPNQGNQGNIREFYFDLKYQGKIREKRKEIGNQGKIREIVLILLITLQKILRIVFNFFNHII